MKTPDVLREFDERLLLEDTDMPESARKFVKAFIQEKLNERGEMIALEIKDTLEQLPKFELSFLGKDWTIESDNGLTEIDFSRVSLVSELKSGETYIAGEEAVKRHAAAPLNADAFRYLWENQEKIPEKWKEKTNGNTTYIFFDGTILRSPNGLRYSLCLFWRDGGWHWYCPWLGSRRDAVDPSAVLASSKTLSQPLDTLNLETRVQKIEDVLKHHNLL